MRALLLWIALAFILTGCAGLDAWMAEPLDPTAPVQDPTATPPVTIEAPGGGSVVYTPPATEPVVTRGDALEQAAGTVAWGLWGPVGAAAVAAMFGLNRSRKKPQVQSEPKPRPPLFDDPT